MARLFTRDLKYFYEGVRPFCLFLFFFTMALMVVISRVTPKAGEKQLQGLTCFSQSPEQVAETRKSRGFLDVVTSLIVVAFCVAFYIYFW